MRNAGWRRHVAPAVLLVGVVVLAGCGASREAAAQDLAAHDLASGHLVSQVVDVAHPTAASTAKRPSTSKASPARKSSPTSKARPPKRGTDGRAIVVKAIKNLSKQGPYRMTSTGSDPKGALDACEVVTMKRYHNTIHGPDGSVGEFIKIGSKAWMKLDSEPWEVTTLPVEGMGCEIPSTLTLRSGTVKSGAGGARQITGSLSVMGSVFPYTARVDKAGRLLMFQAGSGEATVIWRVTYDRSITVRPPI